jgi:hypothetical protein
MEANCFSKSSSSFSTAVDASGRYAKIATCKSISRARELDESNIPKEMSKTEAAMIRSMQPSKTLKEISDKATPFVAL